MKTLVIVAITGLATLFVVGLVVYFVVVPHSLRLFQNVTISRVETKHRTFGAVVQDVVKQVEVKTGKKIRIIFAPETLANNTVERDGGVIGNPPVEGTADDAMWIVQCDFHCHVRYIE